VSAPARLLLFGDEQIPLPGFRRRRPALALASSAGDPEPGIAGGRGCVGQLRLDHTQLLLADSEPEPTQPSLLPEPPFWEGGGLLPARWVDFSTANMDPDVDLSTYLRRKASPAGTQLHLFRAR